MSFYPGTYFYSNKFLLVKKQVVTLIKNGCWFYYGVILDERTKQPLYVTKIILDKDKVFNILEDWLKLNYATYLGTCYAIDKTITATNTIPSIVIYRLRGVKLYAR